jgi:hypothetical protein
MLTGYSEKNMAADGLTLRRRAFWVAGSAWLLGGCFGSFGATRALYDWNKRIDDNKWLQWLVFLVFVILPVYGLFVLADVLVLNTIEFFSGQNPIGTRSLGNGRTLRTSAAGESKLVKHELLERDRVVCTLYMRLASPDEVIVYDEHMQVIGRAHKQPDGSVTVRDQAGHVRSLHSRDAVERAQAAVELGVSPTRAVSEVLAPDARLASSSRGA